MRLGAPLESHIVAFAVCCCPAEGSLQQFVVAHGSRSHWLSERTSREGLLPVRRFVRLLDASIGLPRR